MSLECKKPHAFASEARGFQVQNHPTKSAAAETMVAPPTILQLSFHFALAGNTSSCEATHRKATLEEHFHWRTHHWSTRATTTKIPSDVQNAIKFTPHRWISKIGGKAQSPERERTSCPQKRSAKLANQTHTRLAKNLQNRTHHAKQKKGIR